MYYSSYNNGYLPFVSINDYVNTSVEIEWSRAYEQDVLGDLKSMLQDVVTRA